VPVGGSARHGEAVCFIPRAFRRRSGTGFAAAWRCLFLSLITRRHELNIQFCTPRVPMAFRCRFSCQPGGVHA
jgi:hypothetical protein